MLRGLCQRCKSVIVLLHASAFTGDDLLPTQTLRQLQVTTQDLSQTLPHLSLNQPTSMGSLA